jgi:hypothetical protein
LHETSEQDEKNASCQRFSQAKSLSTSETDHPFVFHELAVGINEALRPENLRIAPVIGIRQNAPQAYKDG